MTIRKLNVVKLSGHPPECIFKHEFPQSFYADFFYDGKHFGVSLPKSFFWRRKKLCQCPQDNSIIYFALLGSVVLVYTQKPKIWFNCLCSILYGRQHVMALFWKQIDFTKMTCRFFIFISLLNNLALAVFLQHHFG